MANVFDIRVLAGTIAAAKDKAVALAGEYGLNEVLEGRVLPVLPSFPGSEISINQAGGYGEAQPLEMTSYDLQLLSVLGTPMVFPLQMKLSSDVDNSNNWWTLPLEPIITINGSNTLVRRKVSKGKNRGSIKENWNVNDYSISISGMLKGSDESSYPEEDVRKLRRIVEAQETVDVKCTLFDLFAIDQIAIESYDFPFTKSEENQGYSIQAYSDDNWNLLLDENGNPVLKK